MLGIIVSLILLIVLVYRGVSVFISSVLAALVAVVMTGTHLPVMESWTEPFMASAAGFVKAYFPVFLVGAIFGAVMNASGAALIVAKFISEKMGEERAMLAVIVASFFLTYGGISVFVVVFAVLPIAEAIFVRSQFPRHILPSAICAGALPAYVAPGSAQFINTIPIVNFGTNIYSGMVIGTIGVVIWLVLGIIYMNRLVKKAKENGEGYGECTKYAEEKSDDVEGSTVLAFAPIALVVIGNFLLTKYYESPSAVEYYSQFSGVNGTWAIIISLTLATLFAIAVHWKQFSNKVETLSKGANDALAPIFNTATQVGFGGVIKSLPAFAVVQAAIFSIGGPKIISVAVGTIILAAVVGSTSGGVAIAMAAFGEQWFQMAVEHNISLDVLHRVIVFSASCLDTLPHSGFIITLLSVCGLSHRESYKDLFVVSCLLPMVGTAGVILAAVMGLS